MGAPPLPHTEKWRAVAVHYTTRQIPCVPQGAYAQAEVEDVAGRPDRATVGQLEGQPLNTGRPLELIPLTVHFRAVRWAAAGEKHLLVSAEEDGGAEVLEVGFVRLHVVDVLRVIEKTVRGPRRVERGDCHPTEGMLANGEKRRVEPVGLDEGDQSWDQPSHRAVRVAPVVVELLRVTAGFRAMSEEKRIMSVPPFEATARWRSAA